MCAVATSHPKNAIQMAFSGDMWNAVMREMRNGIEIHHSGGEVIFHLAREGRRQRRLSQQGPPALIRRDDPVATGVDHDRWHRVMGDQFCRFGFINHEVDDVGPQERSKLRNAVTHENS